MARDVSSSIFPQFNASYILAFQFSSWFPAFSSISIKSTIIRPLDQEFKNYLESDGVFVPEGSEDTSVFFGWHSNDITNIPIYSVAESTLSDEDESESSDRSEPEAHHFSFPELDARIRAAVDEYQAVFPKLNFTSPKVCTQRDQFTLFACICGAIRTQHGSYLCPPP